MIIVRLMGGLGNQMFQYALGRRLALEHDVPLRLDLSWFQVQSLRHYMLDRFKINAEVATSQELAPFTGFDSGNIPARLYRLGQKCIPYYRRNVVKEVKHSFDPLILKAKSNVLLIGYWQSEKYFKKTAAQLRQDFCLKQPLLPESVTIAERMQKANSVSVHVRRKDYVESARRIQMYGACSVEYYQKAAEYLYKIVPNASFFVFSDDISWAASNLTFLSPKVEIVNLQEAGRDEEELILMSYCKHHIIANSSFSWWGAWLGTMPETVTVAPQQWIRDSQRENLDIIPAGWIRM